MQKSLTPPEKLPQNFAIQCSIGFLGCVPLLVTAGYFQAMRYLPLGNRRFLNSEN